MRRIRGPRESQEPQEQQVVLPKVTPQAGLLADVMPEAAPRRPPRVVRVPQSQPDRSAMKLEHVPPDSLVEWDGNPRNNDAAAVELATTIAAHGFIDPIIATRGDRMVRAGHTRLKAAKINEMETVPVIFVNFVSEAMAQAYSLADNRLGEKAAWNTEKLADLFNGELEGVDVSAVDAAVGFAQEEIEGVRAGYELGAGENDPAREWEGMPEYEHEDQTSFRRVVVHFARQEDFDRFAALVGQSLTERTRSIWFPRAEIGHIADKRYGE